MNLDFSPEEKGLVSARLAGKVWWHRLDIDPALYLV